MFDLEEHAGRLVRMQTELTDLNHKIGCIHVFKKTSVYNDMVVIDRSLQDFQLVSMETYSVHLTKRVMRLVNKINLYLEKTYQN